MHNPRTSFAAVAALLLATACTGDIGPHATDDDGPGTGGSSPGTAGRDGSGGAAPPATGPDGCTPVPARLWKLTPEQYAKTMAALVPSAPVSLDGLKQTLDGRGRFSGLASARDLNVPHVQALLDGADGLGAAARAKPLLIAACLANGFDDACVGQALRDFGARAFRRPLTDDESARYLAYFKAESALDGDSEALAQTLRVMVMSPHFLFRWETGDEDGGGALTSHQRAEAVAYLLTDGPPDPVLRQAADRNELLDASNLAGHVERLLAKPENAPGIRRFFVELLETERIFDADKSAERFPDFDDGLRADLATSTQLFIEHVLWQEHGTLADLLTADFGFVNANIADQYGFAGAPATGFGKVAFTDGHHAGLLTQGSFLASHAKEAETDIIGRGKFVRETLLCDELPPPPSNVNVFPPPPDGRNTHRERLAVHSADPGCASCHELMDPVGFALENFDAIGQHRTRDDMADKPIDTSGYLLEEDGSKLAFDDAPGLARTVAGLPRATACFASHVSAFTEGRGGREARGCSESALTKVLRSGSVLEAFTQLLAEPSFWQRVR